MFFCVSLTSWNSVFMCEVVHLRASRYGGHSFARLPVLALRSSRLRACLHSVARATAGWRLKGASEGVRKEGLEPPYPFGYQILSLARLPVPPLSRSKASLPWLRRLKAQGHGSRLRAQGSLDPKP